MGKKVLSVTMVLFAVLVLAGCGPRSAFIKVDPVEVDSPRIAAARGLTIYVKKFEDERGTVEKNVIGEASVGVLNSPATAMYEGDLEEYPARAFASAFSKAGFTVTESEDGADLLFTGIINRLWISEKGVGSPGETAHAEAELDLVLKDNGSGENLWYDIKSAKKRKINFLDATLSTGKVLNQSVEEIVLSVLEDGEFNGAVRKFSESAKRASRR